MSISPKSNRVALLWGDRWWIEGRAEPVVFGDFARAAETLLAAFAGDKPARLRLIHQPVFLAAESVSCPEGHRAILQAALGEQFPALFSEDRAWGFEPIVGGQDRFATVLYHEAQPGLYPLVQTLEDAGIAVEGAWPLAHLLNLVPEDWPDTGALTVVAVAENQALIYRHTPEGRREVQTATGADAGKVALETVRATLTRADTALYVVALDAAGERIPAQLPSLEVPRLRLVSWGRLVAAAETLSRRQPAQMLPLTALFNPRRALIAASVVVGLSALGLAGEYGWAEFTRRQESAANAAAIVTVRSEITTRQQAGSELAAVRTAVEAGTAAAPVFAPWFRSLGAKQPREVVLTTLRANRGQFTLAGGVTRSPAESDWRDWLRSLATPGGRWVLADSPGVPTADFRLVAHQRP